MSEKTHRDATAAVDDLKDYMDDDDNMPADKNDLPRHLAMRNQLDAARDAVNTHCENHGKSKLDRAREAGRITNG